jgi:hypothetical protein
MNYRTEEDDVKGSENAGLSSLAIELFLGNVLLVNGRCCLAVFGSQPTILERQAGGRWLLVPKASSY